LVQAWVLYSKIPTKTSAAAKKNQQLKRDVLQLNKEMKAVSAQDEFSKWAKLRRAHDKKLEECQKSGMC
jgi:tail-anchored protein insertion receptor